tara:strand:+ start:139 stop:462 length:324 start_codon:yes stop_codon:yes gene_type:complete
MIDGIQCKRCGEADTFDTLCDTCDQETADRVERLFDRAVAAQKKGQKLAAEDASVERVLKCGREWQGYLDLAKLQNQMFYDSDYVAKQMVEDCGKNPRLFGFIGRDE